MNKKKLLALLVALPLVFSTVAVAADDPHPATKCGDTTHVTTKCTNMVGLTEPCDGQISVVKASAGTCPSCGSLNYYHWRFDCDGCTYGANGTATAAPWCGSCGTQTAVPTPPNLGAHTVHAGYYCSTHGVTNYLNSYHYICSLCGGKNVNYDATCPNRTVSCDHTYGSSVTHYFCLEHDYVGTSSTCPGKAVDCIPVYYLEWTRDPDPKYTCTEGTFISDGAHVVIDDLYGSNCTAGTTYHLYSNEFTLTEVGAVSARSYDWDYNLAKWEVHDTNGNVVASKIGSGAVQLQPGTYSIHINRTIGEKLNGSAGARGVDMYFYVIGGSSAYPLTEVFDSVVISGATKSFQLECEKNDVIHIAYAIPGMTWSSDCYETCTINVKNPNGSVINQFKHVSNSSDMFEQICFTAPSTGTFTFDITIDYTHNFAWESPVLQWPLYVSTPVKVSVSPAPTSKSLQVGEGFKITPNNSEGSTVAYTSSNATGCVASSDGTVTAKKKGTYTITVTATK